MEILFYAWAVFALFYEIMNVVSPVKMAAHTKGINAKKTDEYTERDKIYGALMMLYAFWTIAGLFSSQWWLFALLLILAVIPGKRIPVIRFLDALLSAAIILAIIINKYHIHYSIF